MNLIIISHRRSGTHLTIDSIINNFGYFTSPFVNIDKLCSYKVSQTDKERIKEKISENNTVIKSHSLPDFQLYCSDEDHLRFVNEVFQNSKKIYIVRNGLDVAVSLYHYLKKFKEEVRYMSFEDFLTYNGWPPESEQTDILSFWAYHLDQWENANYSDEIMFLRYEDWIHNYYETLNKVAHFLNLEPNQKIKDLRLKNISKFRKKALKALHKLGLYKFTSVDFRKGMAGEWKNYFNETMIADIDKDVIKKMKKYGYSLK